MFRLLSYLYLIIIKIIKIIITNSYFCTDNEAGSRPGYQNETPSLHLPFPPLNSTIKKNV